MKQIFFLRHAKSSWDDPSLADFDRPLNRCGLEAAAFIGELMAERGIRPEMIVTSPAKRALETALLVKESSGINSRLLVDENIYEASPITLRNAASRLPDDISNVLLVGHNPGLEGIIRYLTGELEPMPTAALASITLSITSWQMVDAGTGSLDFVLRPKDEMRRHG